MSRALIALADRLVQAVAVICMLALVACVVLGVVSRQTNAPLAWTDELAQMFLVWSALAGWMIALRRRSHIRITMLIDRLPARARAGAEIAIQLCVVTFGLLMLRYGFGADRAHLGCRGDLAADQLGASSTCRCRRSRSRWSCRASPS